MNNTSATSATFTDNTDLNFSDIDLDVLEIGEVRDAVAMPETGASSGSSSCDSHSTCGSASCCCI